MGYKLADFIDAMLQISKTTSFPSLETHLASEASSSAHGKQQKPGDHEVRLNSREVHPKTASPIRTQLPRNGLLNLDIDIQHKIADLISLKDQSTIPRLSKEFKNVHSPLNEGSKTVGLCKEIKAVTQAVAREKFNFLFEKALELSPRSLNLVLNELIKNTNFANHIFAPETPIWKKYIGEMLKDDKLFSQFISHLEKQSDHVHHAAMADMIKASEILPAQEQNKLISKIGNLIFKKPAIKWAYCIENIYQKNTPEDQKVSTHARPRSVRNHIALEELPGRLATLPQNLNHRLLASAVINCYGHRNPLSIEPYAKLISATIQAAMDLPAHSHNQKNFLFESVGQTLHLLDNSQLVTAIPKGAQFHALVTSAPHWSHQKSASLRILINNISQLPIYSRATALHGLLNRINEKPLFGYKSIEAATRQIGHVSPVEKKYLFDALVQMAEKTVHHYPDVVHAELIRAISNFANEEKTAAINSITLMLKNKTNVFCQSKTVEYMIHSLANQQQQLNFSDFSSLLQMCESLIANSNSNKIYGHPAEEFFLKPLLAFATHAHKFPAEQQELIYINTWKAISSCSSTSKNKLKSAFNNDITNRFKNNLHVQRQLSSYVNMKATVLDFLENAGNRSMDAFNQTLRR